MSDESSDRFTFSCADCGRAVSIDKNNPPNDDDILKCFGCGRNFGPYGVVKAALVEASKAKIDELVTKHLGKPPSWD